VQDTYFVHLARATAKKTTHFHGRSRIYRACEAYISVAFHSNEVPGVLCIRHQHTPELLPDFSTIILPLIPSIQDQQAFNGVPWTELYIV